jgi:hypothetical protein
MPQEFQEETKPPKNEMDQSLQEDGGQGNDSGE